MIKNAMIAFVMVLSAFPANAQKLPDDLLNIASINKYSMVPVNGGTFQMGSEYGVRQRSETVVHPVTVNDFAICKYEVTVGQFRKFVKETGYKTKVEFSKSEWVFLENARNEIVCVEKRDASWKKPYFHQTDDNPVVFIAWCDAVEYCNWLSIKEGRTPVYTKEGSDYKWNKLANGYRLPTEAEWEYAARGGNKSMNYSYSGSNDMYEVAWLEKYSGCRTHSVGSKKANELGIFDMTGNAQELCWDIWERYTRKSVTNPTGATSGVDRIIRGGGCIYGAYKHSCVYSRHSVYQRGAGQDTGFRIVLTASF